MKFKLIDSLPSTHTYLKEHGDAEDLLTMIAVREQSAGRGQRGNRWESEPGMNLTFSLQYRPEGVAPREQFAISEAVALAVADTVEAFGVTARVKWPNDVYCGDSKIAGLLIDHELSSTSILRTVVSAGLNVNQTEWLSDAPNPVSLRQLTGKESDLDEVARIMGAELDRRLPMAASADGRSRLHREFLGRLWRGDGRFYPFRVAAGGREVKARIDDVASDGILSLVTDRGERLKFAFKEVEFLR